MKAVFVIRMMLRSALLAACIPALLPPALAADTGAAKNARAAQNLPAALRPVFYRALARDAGAAYDLNKDGCAVLPERSLKACFDGNGAHFTGATFLALRLETYGRGNRLIAVQTVKPEFNGNQSSYRYGSLTEWWRAMPMGFEQGFTIAKRPSGHGELTLALVASRQDARVPNKNMLAWGKLRYGQLVVVDAKGRVVPATLTSKGDRVLIAVNDAHATYPLTVDPLVSLEQKIAASDGAAGDNFGFSVALDGTTALIGATQAEVNGNSNQGAVYVFTESGDTWNEAQKLTASDGTASDGFGWSVALDGTTALVGAPNGEQAKGAAYVFIESGSTWSEAQKLTASDGAALDFFGWSVALDGTTALVGAYQTAVAGNDQQGAAYVFAESGGDWSETQKLTASDGTAFDEFGISVALDGMNALVGAAGTDINGNNLQGAAYLFGKSGGTWSEMQKFTASDGTEFNDFGFSVALNGSTALVGAPLFFSAHGAAYVFDESGGTWAQTQELFASDGESGYEFGFSVALDGATAIVGAPFANVGGNNLQGAAYLFGESGGTWSETQKLSASDGATLDQFAWSVAVDGTTALVGANQASVNGNDKQGAAYFYGGGNGPPVAKDGTLTTEENTAASGTLEATDPDGDPLTFILVDQPAHGTVTLSDASKGAYLYTPDTDYTGPDSFTFKASDGQADSNVAIISITVKAANGPPVASNGSLSTNENASASGTLKASDPDGDALTFRIVAQPKHGKLKLNNASTGSYTYTPNQNYVGSDSFTFKASDGTRDSNTAKVSITVNAVCKGCNPAGGSGGFGWPPLLALLGVVVAAVWMRRRQASRPRWDD